jgi:hypothetical protein
MSAEITTPFQVPERTLIRADCRGQNNHFLSHFGLEGLPLMSNDDARGFERHHRWREGHSSQRVRANCPSHSPGASAGCRLFERDWIYELGQAGQREHRV